MQQELEITGIEPGGVYDLDLLAETVRREYFPGTRPLEIVWGRKIERQKRRSIRLGSYDPRSKIIRIHPLLDSARVPAWFIQSIIHHEYLHHVLGARHNRRFHIHEARFRYHRESRLWLRRHLPMLLGYKSFSTSDLRSRRGGPSKEDGSGQYSLFGD